MIKNWNIAIVGLTFFAAAAGVQAGAGQTGSDASKSCAQAAPTRVQAHAPSPAAHARSHVRNSQVTVAAASDREALQANHLSASGEGEFAPSGHLRPQ